MRYLPALDGLRAIAVLAVLACHTGAPFAASGYIGVDVFFVLSGYLITRVLAEHRPTLREFYIRRLRRLTPALAFMLAAYLAVAPLIVPAYGHVTDASLGLLYLSDYANAFWYTPHYLGHLWSLSVEEHFYLLWPLVFYRFRPSARVLTVAFVAAIIWRWWPGQTGHYFRFDTRASGLILGCLIAQVPRWNVPAWPGLVALALLAAAPVGASWLTQAPHFLAAELAAAFVILGTAPAWMARPSLTYLGKLSYGIYLWHLPIALLLKESGMAWPALLAITLPLSAAMAALSYHTVEALARRRKGLRHLDVIDVQQAGGCADSLVNHNEEGERVSGGDVGRAGAL